MIINGDEIIKRYNSGEIGITPWNEARVGTNSYDVCLFNELQTYKSKLTWPEKVYGTEEYLDSHRENPTFSFKILEDGYILKPDILYLAATEEIVTNKANDLVPMIEGRSSLGRLGISIHATAGFGDIGFEGRWTLEISVIHAVKIYPKMKIAQLYWITTAPTKRRYNGKYQGSIEPMASKLYEEYNNK